MNFYQQIASNKRKSWLIVSSFFVFVCVVVYVFAQVLGYGSEAAGLALIVAGFSSFIGYYFSDRVVLSLSGARSAARDKDFEFYTVTENLCLGSRLPMPKLYVIDDTAMNAFATGRNPEKAVVCATTGLLSRLNRTELEGVIAHELSHIKNYDIRLMSIVAVMVGLIALLSDFFLRWGMFGGSRRDNKENHGGGVIILVVGLFLAILSPIIAQLIKLSISRQREFLADASAAKMTNYPAGLASALAKLSSDREPLEAANKATAHLYIVSPLKGSRSATSWLANLFNTHPPIEERIKRLKVM